MNSENELVTVDNTMDSMIETSISLISELGQYHHEGRGQQKQFHTELDFSCTFHLGVLLSALAWAYKNRNYYSWPLKVKVGAAINKLLYNIQLHQMELEGGLGSCIIKRGSIPSFLAIDLSTKESVQNDWKVLYIQKPDKNTILSIEDSYWMNTRASIHSLSQIITGLYWTKEWVPEFASVVKTIAHRLLSHYTMYGLDIKDPKTWKLGINPYTPVDSLFILLLHHIAGHPVKRSFVSILTNLFYRNYITDIYRNQVTRDHLKTYTLLNLAFCLTHAKYPFSRLVKRMVKECKGEDNLLADSISAYLDYEIRDISKSVLPRTYLCKLGLGHHSPSPWHARAGSNLWASSPYTVGISPEQEDIYGQADLIFAHFIY
jgi:hypothetical protein